MVGLGRFVVSLCQFRAVWVGSWVHGQFGSVHGRFESVWFGSW